MNDKNWLDADKIFDLLFPLFLIEIFVLGNIGIFLVILHGFGVI